MENKVFEIIVIVLVNDILNKNEYKMHFHYNFDEKFDISSLFKVKKNKEQLLS